MSVFWIIAAALTLLALAFVVVPLLRPAPEHDGPDQDSLNIEVYRRRLAELDADLATGVLDQERYDSARKDLERELLYDVGNATTPVVPPAGSATRSSATGKGKRKGKTSKATPEPAAKPKPDRAPILALLLAIALPVAAVSTYLQIGNGGIIPLLAAAERDSGRPAPLAGHHPAMGSGGQSPRPLDVEAERLAAKLEKNPNNLEDWLMLAQTYSAIEQPQKALGAMERAYKLAPDQPDVMVYYAKAIAEASGNRLTGRPAELIQAALKIEPTNPRARGLDGMRAYQEGKFAEAAETWEGLLSQIDAAGPHARQLRQMVSEARARAGLPPLASTTPAAAGASPAATQALAAQSAGTGSGTRPAIQVSVSLDPALAAKVSPDDSLFVFARASAGPPMPLAARRLHASDLPAKVTLDDSMAMTPTMRLSSFPEVVVGARLSKSGQAMPQSGDLEGTVGPVGTAEPTAVSVVIDHIRP